MDYEKLHKDTIAKLQEMVNSKKITVEIACGICADFVPESEDERIRKEIIGFLRNIPNSNYTCEEMAAWLEKQGEQKLAWSEEDEWYIEQLNSLIDGYAVEDDKPNLLKNWLKSLRPQNRWKPSEEQMEALEHFIRSIGESGYASPYDNNTKLLNSLLEQLKKL